MTSTPVPWTAEEEAFLLKVVRNRPPGKSLVACFNEVNKKHPSHSYNNIRFRYYFYHASEEKPAQNNTTPKDNEAAAIASPPKPKKSPAIKSAITSPPQPTRRELRSDPTAQLLSVPVLPDDYSRNRIKTKQIIISKHKKRPPPFRAIAANRARRLAALNNNSKNTANKQEPPEKVSEPVAAEEEPLSQSSSSVAVESEDQYIKKKRRRSGGRRYRRKPIHKQEDDQDQSSQQPAQSSESDQWEEYTVDDRQLDVICQRHQQDRVLVVAYDQHAAIAFLNHVGFKQLISLSEFIKTHSTTTTPSKQEKFPEEHPIDVILILQTPDDWSDALQACLTLLRAKEQQLPLFTALPTDTFDPSKAIVPKLRLGSFLQALSATYKSSTGHKLQCQPCFVLQAEEGHSGSDESDTEAASRVRSYSDGSPDHDHTQTKRRKKVLE